MSLSNLSSSDLRQITKLTEQKESLQAKIDAIDAKINATIGSPSTNDTKTSAKRKTRGPKKGSNVGARRGKVKEAVLKELKAAGKKGITVKEIATKLDTKPANIHAWFHSTGKKIAAIKKHAGGKYSMPK